MNIYQIITGIILVTIISSMQDGIRERIIDVKQTKICNEAKAAGVANKIPSCKKGENE